MSGKINSLLKFFNGTVTDLLSKAPVRVYTHDDVQNSMNFKCIQMQYLFFLVLSHN